jgi:transcriptional regulator with XRE-family HTH domain
MNVAADRLPSRERIAKVVRALRRERTWTQAELAGKLGISQGRLSQIESGGGSFSAEQLLAIFKLFNVTPARFADDLQSHGSQLQNALVRVGARHLYESDQVLPSSTGDDLQRIIGDTLSEGDPRLVTALGPVLVANIDRVPLSKVQLELSRAGFERRLPWLCENLGEAINTELKANPPRAWSKGARRADVVLKLFLAAASLPSERLPAEWDALDAGIRTMKTAVDVKNAASAISRRWRIITTLTPEDFARALRDARASHS